MPAFNQQNINRQDVYLSATRKRLAVVYFILDALFLAVGIMFLIYNSLPSAVETPLRLAWLVLMALAVISAVFGVVGAKEYDVFRGSIYETVFLAADGIWLGTARTVLLVDSPNGNLQLFFGVGLGILFVIALLTHIDWIWYRPIMQFMTKGAAFPLPEVAVDPRVAASKRNASATRSIRRQTRRQAVEANNHAAVSAADQARAERAAKRAAQAAAKTQPRAAVKPTVEVLKQDQGKEPDGATKVLPKQQTISAANAERLAKIQRARRQAEKQRGTSANTPASAQTAQRGPAAQKPAPRTAAKQAAPRSANAAQKPAQRPATAEKTAKRPAAASQRTAQRATTQAKPAAARTTQRPAAKPKTAAAAEQPAKQNANQNADGSPWVKPKKREYPENHSDGGLFIRSESRVYKHLDH